MFVIHTQEMSLSLHSIIEVNILSTLLLKTDETIVLVHQNKIISIYLLNANHIS